MQYRQLGKSGVRVSVIGLGTNQFGGKVDQNGVNEIIDGCLELGINFIDTADIYTGGRSEETLGVALQGKWDKVVMGTKGVSPMGKGENDRGASRYHIVNAVEASLRRMQVDHIDLYQLHRWDDTTPIDESLRALDDLVASGKIRYVGASNYAAWQLSGANLLAEMRGWSPLVTIQPHYHMFERAIEQELIPYCNAYGVGILPYFPLAGGFLTGKYKQGEAAPAGSRGENSPYVQRYMTDKNYAIVAKLGRGAGPFNGGTGPRLAAGPAPGQFGHLRRDEIEPGAEQRGRGGLVTERGGVCRGQCCAGWGIVVNSSAL